MRLSVSYEYGGVRATITGREGGEMYRWEVSVQGPDGNISGDRNTWTQWGARRQIRRFLKNYVRFRKTVEGDRGKG